MTETINLQPITDEALLDLRIALGALVAHWCRTEVEAQERAKKLRKAKISYTNAAVAGALLGAYLGDAAVPRRLQDALIEREKLEGLHKQIAQRYTDGEWKP